MNLYFYQPRSEDKQIVAEAEIHFHADTPLHGMKLTGIVVRKDSRTGELFVTFPARPFGAGRERRYYDFLRSVDAMSSPEGRSVRDRVKEWVLREFRQQGWQESSLTHRHVS